MVELRFNIVNSAIEDKHRMDTEFHKQHEIQFSCNSSEYNCGLGFFGLFLFREKIMFSQAREEGCHSQKVTGYLPCCRMKYHPRRGTSENLFISSPELSRNFSLYC